MKQDDFCCPFALPMMAEESKRKIFEILFLEGEKSVSELTERLGLRQPTVTHHLRQMEGGGLLGSRREGRKVFYFVRMGCPEGGSCFGI